MNLFFYASGKFPHMSCSYSHYGRQQEGPGLGVQFKIGNLVYGRLRSWLGIEGVVEEMKKGVIRRGGKFEGYN